MKSGILHSLPHLLPCKRTLGQLDFSEKNTLVSPHIVLHSSQAGVGRPTALTFTVTAVADVQGLGLIINEQKWIISWPCALCLMAQQSGCLQICIFDYKAMCHLPGQKAREVMSMLPVNPAVDPVCYKSKSQKKKRSLVSFCLWNFHPITWSFL